MIGIVWVAVFEKRVGVAITQPVLFEWKAKREDEASLVHKTIRAVRFFPEARGAHAGGAYAAPASGNVLGTDEFHLALAILGSQDVALLQPSLLHCRREVKLQVLRVIGSRLLAFATMVEPMMVLVVNSASN